MAENMYKMTLEDLEALKREATSAVSEQEWQTKILGTLAGFIRKDPKRYRAYGPYWWVLKRAMLNNGIADFGDTVDAEWFEKADYGNDAYNILAAHQYSEYAAENGLMYSNEHNVSFKVVDEDMGEYEDTRTYSLVDDEVETLALG